jgi:maltose O-acetyltransferase
MRTEKEKMIAGEMYVPLDPELTAERRTARLLFKALNETGDDEKDKRQEILGKLLPNSQPDIWIEPPFYCDYGYNIYAGERVFFNFNCVVLDVAPVYIGSRVMCAPNVQLYTATHPLNAEARSSGREYAKPIRIGDDVWLGGGVIVCPGVSIGDRAVIGAGSVVTRDIPSDSFAAGNPCRVIRAIDQQEEL